jgi:hypothetical protein
VIKPGEEWGAPTEEEPELTVTGDDAALAAVVPTEADHVPLVRFVPDGSELARAVGLARTAADAPPRGVALPLDAIVTDRGIATNAVVVGAPPDTLRAWHRSHRVRVAVDGRVVHDGRATTVVVANGQFWRGADLSPRGHPGDGRLEVQVYALPLGERGAMRRRLPTGTHLPHPRIVTTSGRSVRVDVAGASLAGMLDGHPIGPVRTLDATVRHPALRLLL